MLSRLRWPWLSLVLLAACEQVSGLSSFAPPPGGSGGSGEGAAGAGGSTDAGGGGGRGGAGGAPAEVVTSEMLGCLLPVLLSDEGDFNTRWLQRGRAEWQRVRDGGDLVLDAYAATGPRYAAFESNEGYDFRSCGVLVDLEELPPFVVGVGAHLSLLSADGSIGIGVFGGMLRVFARPSSGADVFWKESPLPSISSFFVMVGIDDGQITWRSSVEGELWTTLAKTAVPHSIDASNLRLRLELHATAEVVGAASAQLDQLNLPK